MDLMLAQNLTQTVPFLHVRNMAASLRFYVDGLGFSVARKWTPDAPDHIRWCWLEAGGGALMLEELQPAQPSPARTASRTYICFMCRDALVIYRQALAHGLMPKKPFVGNGLWVVSVQDPDGFRIDFESPTDVAEETEYDPAVHG